VAQRDIGLMYFGGNGFAHDSREAVKWFSLSARQGQIGAQVNLGIACATGEGTQRNPAQAYVWFNAAASQRTGNSVASKFRDHIATQLSPDQLQKAESIANRCRATNYRDCSVDDAN
jgi:TPR repeat protein